MNWGSGVRAWWALTRRELVRSARQPARIVATIGTAAIVWGVLAGGFAESVQIGEDYAAYLAPGAVAMVVLFTGVFGAMSLIEDREQGLLQSALVSPAPTWAIAGAKLAGAALWAFGQGALLLPALALRQPIDAGAFAAGLVALAGLATGVTGICLAAAWIVRSSATLHGVMNVVLMPMWLFSGAVFPTDGLSPWMRVLTLANPMHWALADVRHALDTTRQPMWIGVIGFAVMGGGLCWFATVRGRGAARDRAGSMDTGRMNTGSV